MTKNKVKYLKPNVKGNKNTNSSKEVNETKADVQIDKGWMI